MYGTLNILYKKVMQPIYYYQVGVILLQGGRPMQKPENTTAHLAACYDSQVRGTIPYYDQFHSETINLIKATKITPKTWLDTGCGTGTLVEKASAIFPDTTFILADPSAEMLAEAKTKLSAKPNSRIHFLDPVPTQDISWKGYENPDIITAIQSHHYLSKENRYKATKVCFDLLNQNGLFISFENIRPFSKGGFEMGKENWINFQLAQGKDPETAQNHLTRFDADYYPITVTQHLNMLTECGFIFVELLWYSYMQAGFYGIK
jgi:tRNA (cmo5U34)-methyltransferase